LPGISIHAVDIARGVLAAGMQVELYALGAGGARQLIARGLISANGTLDEPALAAVFPTGRYEAVFHVARFYRQAGIPLPGVPFLDEVTYRFGISEPQQHYHLPFKFTAWGYSCFRGGA
jgi:5-hydroxyisourate hydrolase